MNSPKIQLPEPCHESWETMTPQGQGRHCAACAKVVIDFSKMTDAQVVDYLKVSFAQKERVCGRFRPDQVQAPLPAIKGTARRNAWMRMAAVFAGLGMLLGACKNKMPHPVGKIYVGHGSEETAPLLGDTTLVALPDDEEGERLMGKPAPPRQADMLGEPRRIQD